MPRPRKWRKVCCLPESSLFGPLNGSDAEHELCTVSVEAYETIRLIDLEGLTQEECAERMQVARGTVQNIYKEARYKIAESLVNGNTLKIEGGDYKLYSDSDQRYGCGRCRRNHCERRFIEEVNEHEEETE